MTCFWDAILQRLTQKDFNNFEKRNGVCISKHSSNSNFVRLLKNFAEKTPDILWNGDKLREKELEENYTHIIEFNPNTINNGYDCSISDPFLFLVCHLFRVNIDHNYNGNLMKYRLENNNENPRLLRFSSNTGHFQVA